MAYISPSFYAANIFAYIATSPFLRRYHYWPLIPRFDQSHMMKMKNKVTQFNAKSRYLSLKNDSPVIHWCRDHPMIHLATMWEIRPDYEKAPFYGKISGSVYCTFKKRSCCPSIVSCYCDSFFQGSALQCLFKQSIVAWKPWPSFRQT